MSESFHPIKAVVRRTGLSAHVLRIWEKRYGAVAPKRTGTNRRLYSEEQIERLNLLRTLTRAGHSIGQVAGLSMDKLRKLAANADAGSAPPSASPSAAKSPNFLAECLTAIRALDTRALESTLQRAEMELGLQGLLQRVVAPLAQRLGDLWRAGDLTAAHEHLATGVLRIFLGHAAKLTNVSPHDPVIVVVTPLGQVHELGALLAMTAASNLGWQVTYLGASLPAAEIAGAARQNRARVVALSLVYPEDDPRLAGELARLRELLPADVTVVAGGRAAPAYRKTLDRLGVFRTEDLSQFCNLLDDLRQPKPSGSR